MRALLLPALLSLIPALPAGAETVMPCDDRIALTNLAWNWADNIRFLPLPQTNLAVLDMVEPVCCARFIVVISPPYDDYDNRQCRMVGMTRDEGFYDVELSKLDATLTGQDMTNPDTVSLRIPVRDYGDGTDLPQEWLTIEVDLFGGAVTASRY